MRLTYLTAEETFEIPELMPAPQRETPSLFSERYVKEIEEGNLFPGSPIRSFQFWGEPVSGQTTTAPVRLLEIKRKEERQAVIPPTIPELEGLNTHSPMLTSTTRELLHILWVIVISKAMQARFPIKRTIVAVFRDPSEDRQQILLRVFTQANAAQAVAFWNGLENDLEEWVSELDEFRRLVFLKQISLRIHWQ